MRNLGSMRNGYASNAAKLPRLLAAYRKYGFCAAVCLVPANQRCSIGAPADSAKNGRPNEIVSRPSSQPIGSAIPGGWDQEAGTWIGRTDTAEPSSTGGGRARSALC